MHRQGSARSVTIEPLSLASQNDSSTHHDGLLAFVKRAVLCLCYTIHLFFCLFRILSTYITTITPMCLKDSATSMSATLVSLGPQHESQCTGDCFITFSNDNSASECDLLFSPDSKNDYQHVSLPVTTLFLDFAGAQLRRCSSQVPGPLRQLCSSVVELRSVCLPAPMICSPDYQGQGSHASTSSCTILLTGAEHSPVWLSLGKNDLL